MRNKKEITQKEMKRKTEKERRYKLGVTKMVKREKKLGYGNMERE